MQITKWELSEIPEDKIQTKGNALFSEGHHIIKIISAVYLDEYTAEKPTERDTYSITVEDVNNGNQTTLRYWLKNKERTMFVDSVVGTLNSLGKSIFGPTFAFRIPAPGDIIGAVVDAEFKVVKDTTDSGKSYNRVYHYNPVSADNSIFADIEQYYKE